MTNEPIRLSAFLMAASSSFLTKLVKPGVISRAKTAATGLFPLAQIWQRFSPASGPFTFNGLKTDTVLPGSRPDFRSAPRPARAIAPTTAAESIYRDIIKGTFLVIHGTTTNVV